MKRQALFVVAVATALASFAGCKKKEPVQPQPLTPATGYPAAYPTAPAAGLPPSPLSPACQQLEGTCAWARCNMTAGRCAFPCGSDSDCIQNARCIGAGTALAVCAPANVPGMTPAPAPASTQPTM